MRTEWYYAVEGTSHGPVNQAEFERLVSAGTIRSDTLVWQEGMEDWLPYNRAGAASEGAAPMQPRMPVSEAHDPAREDANTFVGALKDGFARYVDFKTRSTRSQFWWWTLWSIIISMVSTAVDFSIGAGDSGPVGLLTSLAMFIPSIAVACRRLHDIGRTGWWQLLMFIPLIGWIVLIVFYCTRTQEEANQWGMPPRR
ncbi:DUF805 domain-containing protein [Sulfitobacter sp. F26169L]|uniref:DUF805 domain-containing protein n=1 Tax=Sulfitobacter sp. F26169L TaxID=2996015 RepID=UPI0022610394|nr:DUF805 domain-containing protein [Sulfitobacter sp. F26169L]MCX7566558.1 DUF805 domain-containing protein [Sulfitobacter sp. F26169L]